VVISRELENLRVANVGAMITGAAIEKVASVTEEGILSFG